MYRELIGKEYVLIKIIYDFLYRMKQYDNRTQGLNGLHVSLIQQLTDVEKKLVASQEVLEIRGKVSLG